MESNHRLLVQSQAGCRYPTGQKGFQPLAVSRRQVASAQRTFVKCNRGPYRSATGTRGLDSILAPRYSQLSLLAGQESNLQPSHEQCAAPPIELPAKTLPGVDSNHQSSGSEPDGLPITPPGNLWRIHLSKSVPYKGATGCLQPVPSPGWTPMDDCRRARIKLDPNRETHSRRLVRGRRAPSPPLLGRLFGAAPSAQQKTRIRRDAWCGFPDRAKKTLRFLTLVRKIRQPASQRLSTTY